MWSLSWGRRVSRLIQRACVRKWDEKQEWRNNGTVSGRSHSYWCSHLTQNKLHRNLTTFPLLTKANELFEERRNQLITSRNEYKRFPGLDLSQGPPIYDTGVSGFLSNGPHRDESSTIRGVRTKRTYHEPGVDLRHLLSWGDNVIRCPTIIPPK